MRRYRDAGGDTGSDALLSFYGAYRALVRVKVALLRATQLQEPAAVAAARAQTDELLSLAERFAWRTRGPIAVAVSGPPASGKSTLAAALARRAGWPVLSSDVLRKHRRGLPLDVAAAAEDYTPAARAEIPARALGARASTPICSSTRSPTGWTPAPPWRDSHRERGASYGQASSRPPSTTSCAPVM